MVEDHIDQDFMGLVNYAIIAMIQMDMADDDPMDLDVDLLRRLMTGNRMKPKH